MLEWKYGVIFFVFIVIYLVYVEFKNVIVIFVDDLGWNDIILFGNDQFLEIFNLERLVEQGMFYIYFYINNLFCLLNRVLILIGQIFVRYGLIQLLYYLDNVRLVVDLLNLVFSNRMLIVLYMVICLDMFIFIFLFVLK